MLVGTVVLRTRPSCGTCTPRRPEAPEVDLANHAKRAVRGKRPGFRQALTTMRGQCRVARERWPPQESRAAVRVFSSPGPLAVAAVLSTSLFPGPPSRGAGGTAEAVPKAHSEFAALAFDMFSGADVWAGNGLGLWRTDDNGGRWHNITPTNLVGDDTAYATSDGGPSGGPSRCQAPPTHRLLTRGGFLRLPSRSPRRSLGP